MTRIYASKAKVSICLPCDNSLKFKSPLLITSQTGAPPSLRVSSCPFSIVRNQWLAVRREVPDLRRVSLPTSAIVLQQAFVKSEVVWAKGGPDILQRRGSAVVQSLVRNLCASCVERDYTYQPLQQTLKWRGYSRSNLFGKGSYFHAT